MADMFIYASQTETYGRVLVEAMAARLPVVVLDASSLGGIVVDKVHGRIVYKKTIRTFVETIKEVLSDKVQQKHYALAGHKTAVTDHDSEVSINKLLKVYKAVSGQKTKYLVRLRGER